MMGYNKNEVNFIDYSEIFYMIKFSELPKQIQDMLSCNQSDCRVETVDFLISFFSLNMGYSRAMVIQILTAYKNSNAPSSEDMVIANLISNNYGKFQRYSSILFNKFGYIEFEKDSKLYINLPNKLINKFDILHDCALRIYIAIAAYCKLNNVNKCSKQSLVSFAKVSEKTIERRVGELITGGFVNKLEVKNKIHYCIEKEIPISNEFTRVSVNQLLQLLQNTKDISDGSIKVYVFLKYHLVNEILDIESNEYQIVIGKMNNKKANTISNITTILKNKGFIKKSTYREERFNPNTGKRENILRCRYQII